MELDNVLKKLRKLQKLYEGAKTINSESEAATAAALIQKLLIEYNLTMAEVTDSEKVEEDEIKEHFCSGFNYRSVGGKWEYQLWYILCKWNFCKCFMYGNAYKRLVIFGKKESARKANPGTASYPQVCRDCWNEGNRSQGLRQDEPLAGRAGEAGGRLSRDEDGHADGLALR